MPSSELRLPDCASLCTARLRDRECSLSCRVYRLGWQCSLAGLCRLVRRTRGDRWSIDRSFLKKRPCSCTAVRDRNDAIPDDLSSSTCLDILSVRGNVCNDAQVSRPSEKEGEISNFLELNDGDYVLKRLGMVRRVRSGESKSQMARSMASFGSSSVYFPFICFPRCLLPINCR